MSETLDWSFKAHISNGLTAVASGKMILSAQGKIVVTVPKKDGSAGTATVHVQPGDGGQFLLITSTVYEDLEYKVDSVTTPRVLDGAHILVGSGAVSLLGDTQNTFVFENNGTEDATVTILVGRDATL